MKTFNQFLEERIASGDLWHRQSLQTLLAALKFGGWEIRHPFELDQFMQSRPTMFYAGANADGSDLDMNVIWTMYRAAYPERVEQRLLIAQ